MLTATPATAQTPSITQHPTHVTAGTGATATFTVTANRAESIQWQRDGVNLSGATNSSLTLASMSPARAGLYTAAITNATGSVATKPAILGLTTSHKVVGDGMEIGVNILHSAGYVFDQILPNGIALAVTADAGQVTRLSYIDLDDDIVVVEFSGPGTLSLVLANASGPASPVNYNQPTVSYMKGHVGLVITGATEATSISVSAVGRATTFDPTGTFNLLLPISESNNPANNRSTLFSGHASTLYDGIADIAYIAILSTNGKFGAIRTAQASYFASQGLTGIYAPDVEFTGPIIINDLSAFDAATAVLVTGSVSEIHVEGGDLLQANARPVWATGFVPSTDLLFTAGTDAHGTVLAAQPNRAVFTARHASENALAPAITSFTPLSGKRGTTITITGANFLDVTAVRLGDATVSFTVDSPTRITATVPVNAVSGILEIATSTGIAKSTTSFTVEPPGELPVITSAAATTAVVSEPFTFAVTTQPAATHFNPVELPHGISIDETTGVISGTFAEPGSHVLTFTAQNVAGSQPAALTVVVNARPTLSTQPQDVAAAVGASTTLSVEATGSPAPTFQWTKNGTAIAGATSPSLVLPDLHPEQTGSYQVVITNVTGSVTSRAAIVGLASATKVEGDGTELNADVRHTNGNVYDQVLLKGPAVAITADPAQATRVSFIDLDDDIVQVEFSGAGTLTLTLESSSPPAAPVNYHQPAVLYMKGHASIVISGANETTHVSVFSVGRVNAFNQSLFKDVPYDAVADIGSISITSTNGRFGSIRTANAHYFRGTGQAGIYAPGVTVEGPVYLGDLTADDDATPVLLFGAAADVRVTGGSLLQLNQRPVQIDGVSKVQFADGMTSHGTLLPAQSNQAMFERNGIDVTAILVP